MYQDLIDMLERRYRLTKDNKLKIYINLLTSAYNYRLWPESNIEKDTNKKEAERVVNMILDYIKKEIFIDLWNNNI